MLNVGIFFVPIFRFFCKGGQLLHFFLQEIEISSSLGADADDMRKSQIMIIADSQVCFCLLIFDVYFIHDEDGVLFLIFVHDISEDMLFLGSDANGIIYDKKDDVGIIYDLSDICPFFLEVQ